MTAAPCSGSRPRGLGARYGGGAAPAPDPGITPYSHPPRSRFGREMGPGKLNGVGLSFPDSARNGNRGGPARGPGGGLGISASGQRAPPWSQWQVLIRKNRSPLHSRRWVWTPGARPPSQWARALLQAPPGRRLAAGSSGFKLKSSRDGSLSPGGGGRGHGPGYAADRAGSFKLGQRLMIIYCLALCFLGVIMMSPVLLGKKVPVAGVWRKLVTGMCLF